MEIIYQQHLPTRTGRRADRIIGLIQQLHTGLWRGFYPNDGRPLSPNAMDFPQYEQAVDYINHQWLCREIAQ